MFGEGDLMDADDLKCSNPHYMRKAVKATYVNQWTGTLLCLDCAQKDNRRMIQRGMRPDYIPMKEYVMKCLMKAQ